MKSASTALLALLALASLGLWGCTQQKNGATNTKIRELEARYQKLEEDYHVVVAASETSRKKIAQLERERGELNRQLADLKVITQERDNLVSERDNLVSERNDLAKQVKTRTTERDALHGQLVQFGKDLQTLMTRVDTAAAASPAGSVTAAIPTSRSAD
jgi:chromosome segregation ATPase